MTRFRLWHASLGLIAMLLAGCSQGLGDTPAAESPLLEDAIGTGIALTQNAEKSIDDAVASAVAATQTAFPTATASLTPIPPTNTSLPTLTPTVSPEPPTPTTTPTLTPTKPTDLTGGGQGPTPTSTKPATDVVYDAYRTIQTLASLNDSQYVDCEAFVDSYNHLASLPEAFDGIGEYGLARAHVIETSRDEKLFCDAYLAGANTDNTIPFIQWGLSRQGTGDALELLRPIIVSLGYLP